MLQSLLNKSVRNGVMVIYSTQ